MVKLIQSIWWVSNDVNDGGILWRGMRKLYFIMCIHWD